MAGFEFLDHTADVGLRSRGLTLAEALTQGALGLFCLVAEVEHIAPEQSVGIQCSSADEAGLFVEMLNELLYQQDVGGLFFCEFEITSLHEDENGFHLEGGARGEPMDFGRHQPGLEVKAATYGGLRYYVGESGEHVLQCVLDV